MSRRRLTHEEAALWRRVARTTEALRRDRPGVPFSAPDPARSLKTSAAVEPFEIGAKADAAARRDATFPGVPAAAGDAPVRMDRKAYGKLKRGKLKPEARLDLHGMTLDQAYPALAAFVLRQQAKGNRLVLIITGKGRAQDEGGPVPVRSGILRHSVPQWLSLPPLAQAVLQVSEAHGRHGGSGAFYVYLKRGGQQGPGP